MSVNNENQQEIWPNSMLSDAVSKILAARKWSLRRASINTGVPYSTIDRMSKGQNVEAEQVARFAYHIADSDKKFETVLEWLRFARKDDFVSILNAVAGAARNLPETSKRRVELSTGKSVVMPSGMEFEATAENLAMIETLLSTFQKVKQNTQ